MQYFTKSYFSLIGGIALLCYSRDYVPRNVYRGINRVCRVTFGGICWPVRIVCRRHSRWSGHVSNDSECQWFTCRFWHSL